ncbi:MAG: glycosyltransferase family 2 protein [Saccharofermentans sp.]|nr:glycosyltransferase family 2 protein [Saccharofermentans sp.]
MKKIVIIPAYNESECILNTVEDIRNNAADFDFVVINDQSSDDTGEICRENNIPVINLPINLGIGGAVQTGYLYAFRNGYDVAVQFDGDGQHPASYLNSMYDALIENKADIVVGSRFIDSKGFQSTALRRFGIRYFTLLIKMITGKTVLDPTSGFRMVNRDTMKTFAYDYPRDFPEPETAVTVLKMGKRLIEMPVEMRVRQAGKSSIHLFKSVYYMIKVSLAIILEGSRRYDDR